MILTVVGCSKPAYLPTEEILSASSEDHDPPFHVIVGYTDASGLYHDYQGVVVAAPPDSLSFSVPGQPDSARVLPILDVPSISYQATETKSGWWLAGAVISAGACVWIATWDTTWE